MPGRVVVGVVNSPKDAVEFETRVNEFLKAMPPSDVVFSSASSDSKVVLLAYIRPSMEIYKIPENGKTGQKEINYPSPDCPVCGTPMVLRARREDPSMKFWGCRRFPDCKGIVNLDDWKPPQQGQTSEVEEDNLPF